MQQQQLQLLHNNCYYTAAATVAVHGCTATTAVVAIMHSCTVAKAATVVQPCTAAAAAQGRGTHYSGGWEAGLGEGGVF